MNDKQSLETENPAHSSNAEEGENLPRYDLVCYLLQEWDILPRRPHLTALGQLGKVLLVQVPITIDSPLRKPVKFMRWLTGKDRLSRLSETLFLARPLALVPYGISFRYPWLRRINRWLMGIAVHSLVRRLKFKPKAAVIFDSAQSYLVGLAGEELLCYEIVDQYANYTSLSPDEKAQIVREENELLRKADIVFIPNASFMEEKSRSRSHTYVVSNTVDVDLFAKAHARETQAPTDLERIPGKRIGYIGNINSWMDCDLLNYLAQNHPEWSFVLLGRVDGTKEFRGSSAFKTLQQQPNAHFLGWRDYTLLPNYLKGMHACMLPWMNNNLTMYHQPNKLFQYLAAGKPIVSTALPQVIALNSEIGDLISIANDYQEFAQLLSKAMSKEEDKAVVEKRLRAANRYSSLNMARERIKHIADYYAEPDSLR